MKVRNIRNRSFGKQVDRVLAGLPKEYAEQLNNVVFLVEDRPDPGVLAGMGIDHPDELLGFYDGIPLTERTHDQIPSGPDRIFLFRKAIEEESRVSGLLLERVIRETLWHEIAHYFGFSEEEMDRIEQLWADSMD